MRGDDSYAERGDRADLCGEHYQKVDENIDLYGLSAANVAAALSGGFVVNGSPTQTAMMEDAGGQSQMAQVATAVVVGAVLLFLTGPLQYLPTSVLGVLVFLVALRLINFIELQNIRSESPQEYALAVMTARGGGSGGSGRGHRAGDAGIVGSRRPARLSPA